MIFSRKLFFGGFVFLLCLITLPSNAKTTANSSIEKRYVQICPKLASPIILTNQQSHNYLEVSLIGDKFESAEQRPPINLALVIDQSSSMEGERIKKARDAAIMAINLLTESDTISVIVYDDEAKVLIPATKVTNKEQLINTINKKIETNSMSALFAGLSKGINQVDKYLNKTTVNRIILLSDGQTNIGPTSIGELSELAMIAARKNIAITTIGLGTDYNESLMASIAEYSDGNHVFVDDSTNLENVFTNEFADIMSVIAQEVTVTITLNNNVRPIRLLGRNGIINGNTVHVNINQLYSNQEKYILLELQPEQSKQNSRKTIAKIDVTYQDLINKTRQHYQDDVIIVYTTNPKSVKKSQNEHVMADVSIQQATMINEDALMLYNQGLVVEAKGRLQQNTNKLKAIVKGFASSKAKLKANQQIQKNQIMIDCIDTKDAEYYRKLVTEMQYNAKQGNIK